MKISRIVVAVGLLVTLAGCGGADPAVVNQDTGNSTSRFHGIKAEEISIITDSETGCKYIWIDDGIGNYRTTALSPLMKDSKTVDCSK